METEATDDVADNEQQQTFQQNTPHKQQQQRRQPPSQLHELQNADYAFLADDDVDALDSVNETLPQNVAKLSQRSSNNRNNTINHQKSDRVQHTHGNNPQQHEHPQLHQRRNNYQQHQQQQTKSELPENNYNHHLLQRHRPVNQQYYYSIITTTTKQHPQLLFEQTGELLILAIIIGMWLSAIAVFLHRWRSIRIVRAPGTRMASYRPKNLEAIKVVAKHRDSVIYKNLPETMSRTLEARQKRLSRMSTVPNIKIGEQLQQLLPQQSQQSLFFSPLLMQQQLLKEQPVMCFGKQASLPQLQQFLQQQLMQQLQLLQQTQQANFQQLAQQNQPQLQQPHTAPVVSFEKSTIFSSSNDSIFLSLATVPSLNCNTATETKQLLPQHQSLETLLPQHKNLNQPINLDIGTANFSEVSETVVADGKNISDSTHIETKVVLTGEIPHVIKIENETHLKCKTDDPVEIQSFVKSEAELLKVSGKSVKIPAKPKPILKSQTGIAMHHLLAAAEQSDKQLEKPLKSILKRTSTRQSFMPIHPNSNENELLTSDYK